MTERSRLYGLMAKRETARRAKTLTELRNIAKAQSEADHLSERLSSLLDAHQTEPGTVTGVAQLRMSLTMTGKLAAECERVREQAAALEGKMQDVRKVLATQDHKARFLEDATRSAKIAEAELREEKAAAAMPTPRRG